MLNIKHLILFACIIISCNKKVENNIPVEKQLEIKGADMSLLPEIRQSGMVFKNTNGQPEDMLVTLKNSGVTVIRLRLWKNPTEPNSNFTTVKKLSKEIKSMGMKVLLTVHYSDSWADPGQQNKPLQWQGISFDQLKDSVYTYTKKIITEIDPEYIQIGNEINNGLLWPDGSSSNITQLRLLLQEGINAVKETNPTTKTIIHFAGYENANAFFTSIADLNYDIIGISYYPLWHGKDLEILKQHLVTISNNHNKPIFIAETSYPFTLEWNDDTHNVIGLTTQILPQFPPTPLGQEAYLTTLKEIIKDVPKGIGFCYWGSEWASYKGKTSTNGSPWENQAFWDFENKSLPVLQCFK